MEVIDDAVKHVLDYVVKTNAFRKDIHAALPDLEQHATLSRSVAGGYFMKMLEKKLGK